VKIFSSILKGMLVGVLISLIAWVGIFFWPSCQGNWACISGCYQCVTSGVGSRGCREGQERMFGCEEYGCVDTEFTSPRYMNTLIFCIGIGAWIGALFGVGEVVRTSRKRENAPSLSYLDDNRT